MSRYIPHSLSGTTGQMRAVLKTANSRIFRAFLSIASAALLIRGMGMLNQIIVTARFGEGATMDAYIVATTLPLLLVQLIGNTTETAVIPVYSWVRARSGSEKASHLFSTLLNLSLISTGLLSVGLLLFHTQVVQLSAPALDAQSTSYADALTPLIYPALILMVIIGFLESILNAEGQFGWPAYVGLLVPLCTAIAALLLGKTQGVVALCIGTMVGLVFQLGAFLFRTRKARITYHFMVDMRDPAFKKILVIAWPAFLGSIISLTSPLIDQIFASFLSTGSISALNYALKIISIFTGVIFASVGRAALPYLSRHAGLNDMNGFKKTLHLYLWNVGIATAILSVLLIVFAHPLVQLLFQRGAFSSDDTNHTAITLSGFAIGLAPMSFNFMVAQAFSAIGKTRLLLFMGIFNIIANAILDYVFARLWQSEGIALATSVMYFCVMLGQCLLLQRIFGKFNIFTPPAEVVMILKKYLVFSPLRALLLRFAIAMLVFVVGIYGVIQNTLYTLRISLGLALVLAFLRYRYALLLAWAILDVFIGSSFPLFNGNNLDTGLTISTLLVLTQLPVKRILKDVPFLFLLLLFLLWVFASIGISPISIGTFFVTWLLLLDYAAVGVLAIHVLRTEKHLTHFIDAILLVSFFIAVFGVYSYVTHQNGIIEPGTDIFRSYSVFGSAPTCSLFFSFVIPLAFYRALTLRGFKLIGMIFIIVTMLLALAFTYTRSTFICVPLSLVIMALFLPHRKTKLTLFISIGILALGTVLMTTVWNVPLFERFFSNDILTLNNRTYLWQAVMERFDPTQLLGNGLQAADTLLTNLQVGYGGVIGTNIQNLYLEILFDHGIIGLALFLLVIIALLFGIIKGLRNTTGNQRMLYATALAVLASMLIMAFESSDLLLQTVGIYFWLIMILPFASCWSLPRSQRTNGDITDLATLPVVVAHQYITQEQYTHA